jgi:glutathionylspermidine synthase
MKRELHAPRAAWREKMETLGFHFHSIDGVYWDERVAYRFGEDQIDQLESVTAELHRLCLAAVRHVIETARYQPFGIPMAFIELIEKSWHEDDATVMGRFDLSWNGVGEPKLLEYNADTPTSLIEASVAQWHWLEEVVPHADQFNSIHEKLIDHWGQVAKRLGHQPIVHFSCVADSQEDVGNVEYLRDTAHQAGIDARWVAVSDVGWNGHHFVDQLERRINTWFKLYPWEWLMREPFGRHLIQRSARIIEPAWKAILSNKAILPILWELNPGHPNLLPAYFDARPLGHEYVRKPLLSREGANVTLVTRSGELATSGTYGSEGFVYQAYAPLPRYVGESGDVYPVIGSWVIGNQPAGIGLREDDSLITKNSSRFVPHFFE